MDTYLIKHIACPLCGSVDNNGLFSDGHEHCFTSGCKHHTFSVDGYVPSKDAPKDFRIAFGESVSIPARGLKKETCDQWKYWQGVAWNPATEADEPCQIANYLDDSGNIVAQKIRYKGKDFRTTGAFRKVGFYGQWRPIKSFKKLVIVEGEIDALSLSQAYDYQWPVVSVPSGAQSAGRVCKEQMQWLMQFEEIILLFDNDKPGRDAALECAKVLPPGKVFIGLIPSPHKDANDMLKGGQVKDLLNLIWKARPYRPEGIVRGSEVLELLLSAKDVESYPYPWSDLNVKTHELRKRELVIVTAYPGIGKSSFCREIAYNLATAQNQKVGYIALEESIERTAFGFLGLHLNKALHISRNNINQKEIIKAYEEVLKDDRINFYNHFGSINPEVIKEMVRFLVKAYDCQWIILDHVSIVISGLKDGDERRLIDNIMTALRTLVEELGIGMIVVCHLNRQGQLRGSAAFEQLADLIIELSRPEDESGNLSVNTKIDIRKNRFSGEVGDAGWLSYNLETSRLTEVPYEISQI